MTEVLSPGTVTGNGHAALPVETARVLATTSKTRPQAPWITSRWLLRRLQWVEAAGGSYRRNQTPARGDGQRVPVDVVGGEVGQPTLATTFVPYDPQPPERRLHFSRTVLGLNLTVADLLNTPYDQTREQILLAIEAVREHQDDTMINDPEIGLLSVVTPDHRLVARDATSLLDDLDELLGRRRDPQFFLAHPRAIVALSQECTRRGLTVPSTEIDGKPVPAWHGLPIFPCPKIPVTKQDSTSVLVLRTGDDNRGVVGLHQTGLADEWETSLNVRFMGITHDAVVEYMITSYYGIDVLTPDALGVLENIPLPAVR